MAGRKQFDPERALDAAVRVFWQHGYAGTSISDLLAATGLNRGSLYSTYGDKQHLFLACLQRYLATVGAVTGAALSTPAGSAAEQVQAGFDAVLDRMANPGNPSGCLLARTAADAAALEPPVRAAVRRVLEQQTDQLHTLLLTHGQADGEDRALAVYLVAVSQALAVMHAAGVPVDQLRDVARLAVTTVAARGL